MKVPNEFILKSIGCELLNSHRTIAIKRTNKQKTKKQRSVPSFLFVFVCMISSCLPCNDESQIHKVIQMQHR
jgi:hypothetical protein